MTLYVNANIITMNHSGETYNSMRIKGDRIVELGNDLKYNEQELGKDVVNLHGKTILPGFYDSHLHLISTFLNQISINFEKASSIQEVLDLISAWPYKNKYPIVIGKRLSEFKLKEGRLPTRTELDRVSKDFPVVISSFEFHTVLMNTFAINQFKIPFVYQGYEKDENKSLTGIIRNKVAYMALKKVYGILEEKHYLLGAKKTFNESIRKGVTTMVTVEGGPLFHPKHPEIILKNRENFPIDVELFYPTTNLKKVLKYNLPRVGGDIFLDGSFTSQNAALYEPYSDSHNNCGSLYFTDSELVEFIEQSHDLDLQVSVHAVGPRAIESLLNAYEIVLKKKPKADHRHRIEHFELPLPQHIERVKSLGLVLAMHPTYEIFFREEGMMYDTRLGKERALMTNPFRQIVDAGIKIAGCSDSDVMPIDPLLGVHAAVNHPNPNSRITPYEALEMYTINGAYAIFQDKQKGSLQIGKKADFVILDQNPLTVDHLKIKDIKVCSTFKNGRCLFGGKNYD